MHIHHLNCVSLCPLGGRLTDGRARTLLERGHLSCHCLLIEGDDGLVLVDTGLGLRDVRDPRSRLSRFFLTLDRPELREDMTAIRQVRQLGFRPEDVRHIILTHLDFDHAGGLDDFPHARVHLLTREHEYAARQKTWLDRQRFRPQQWSTRGQWHTYSGSSGSRWMGFDCVRDLEGLPPEILLVPLPGHTFGHAGVAIESEGRWRLLAGDAYFHHSEMDPLRPQCPVGLRMYQWMMDKDHDLRRANQRRLRELRQLGTGTVEVFCSHDVTEFERLSGRSARLPAQRLPPAVKRPARTDHVLDSWDSDPRPTRDEHRPTLDQYGDRDPGQRPH